MGSRLTHAPLSLRMPRMEGKRRQTSWPAGRFHVVKTPKKMVILDQGGVGKGAADLEHLRSLYWRGRGGIDGLSDVIAHICSALRSHEIHAHACPPVISDTFCFRAYPILFLFILILRKVSKMLFYLESIEGSKSVLREELK